MLFSEASDSLSPAAALQADGSMHLPVIDLRQSGLLDDTIRQHLRDGRRPGGGYGRRAS